MPSFIINAKKPTKLDKLGANRILVKKIEVTPVSTDIKEMLYPIVIETAFATGRKTVYHLHPIQFFHNYGPSAKFAATNKPIERAIPYCKFSSAQIFVVGKENQGVTYKISYEKLNELIQVFVTETFDGFSFGLNPDSIDVVKDYFPSTVIANNLSISRSTLFDFQTSKQTIHPYVLTALTGLDEEEVKFFDYQIIDSSNGKVIFDSTKRK